MIFRTAPRACRLGARPKVGLEEAEFEGATGGEGEAVRAEEWVRWRHATRADLGDRTEKRVHRRVNCAGAMAAPAAGWY